MTLRVVEVYASYQGEGPNTSKPTVFVRFAGCNFKCAGWPCDTQHAIDPKIFTKLQVFFSPIDLAELVLGFGVSNICLTGGEVFLQSNNDLVQFVNAVKATEPAWTIECFTNGSLPWGEHLPGILDNFILDWKLPDSGETYIAADDFMDNFNVLNENDAIKFTIRTRADYEEAKRRYFEFIKDMIEPPMVYAGVVWGALNTEVLCGWMLNDDLDWHLNVQVHKFVWHPDTIGV